MTLAPRLRWSSTSPSTASSVPQDALRDIQFYVWFQIFSRLVEASFLVALVLGYLPYSTYAMYTPLVLLYAACCLPSVTVLGKLVCQALQRFDYQNLLDLVEQRVLVFLVPIPFVFVFRAWGRAHSDFGEAYGAAIGLGVGTVATQLLVMVIGFYALRRLGVPLRRCSAPTLTPQRCDGSWCSAGRLPWARNPTDSRKR